MKKWLTGFLVNLYLVQVFLVLLFFHLWEYPLMYFLLGLFLLSVILSVVLFIINIVCAVRILISALMNQDKVNKFPTIAAYKLGLIPFFIINFVLWLIFAGATANPFLFLLWIIIPVGIIYTYMVLLGTSCYSISQIVILCKKGILTKKQSIFHIILQLFFLADIFDCLYLCLKFRKR